MIAGVRRAQDGEAIAAAHPGHVTPVALDITNEAQVAALDSVLPTNLDAVVNNAGIAVVRPIEEVPLSEFRRQLEVNVIGQAAVT